MSEKYNGWTNYETWDYKLWLDNDEGTYGYWNERARECFENAEADRTFSKSENAAFELKDEMKQEAEEGIPEITGFYADILNAAISEVNFYEVAEAIIDDLGLEEEQEQEKETESENEDGV